MINFSGPAKRLDDIDLPRIAALISVGEDELHALLDVESSGHGFDAQNRPVALYEPHVAWRNCEGTLRDKLVAAGLAYPKWGEKPYPKDSYPRILAAQAINETVALKATSWGLGQILGENYKAAGYASVQDMVSACVADEENQLAMMVRFIKANGLDDELRRHDWAGLARGYNGPQYAKNNYDARLAAAFAKWQKIKDTPYTLEDIRNSAAHETAAHEAGAPPPSAPVIAPPSPPDIPAPKPPAAPKQPDLPKPPPPAPETKGWFAGLLETLRTQRNDK